MGCGRLYTVLRCYGATPIRVFHDGHSHGFKDLHRFRLKHYLWLSRWRPGRKLCLGRCKVTKSFWHDHSRIWVIIAAIMALVFTSITQTQCPNVDIGFLNPAQFFLNPKSTAVLRKNSTGSLIPTWEGDSLFCWFLWSIFCIFPCRAQYFLIIFIF